MKVKMIGSQSCHRCHSIRPRIEEYCTDNEIEFHYINMSDIDSNVAKLLKDNRILQLPAFIIDREGRDRVVLSGDDIFLELKSIN